MQGAGERVGKPFSTETSWSATTSGVCRAIASAMAPTRRRPPEMQWMFQLRTRMSANRIHQAEQHQPRQNVVLASWDCYQKRGIPERPLPVPRIGDSASPINTATSHISPNNYVPQSVRAAGPSSSKRRAAPVGADPSAEPTGSLVRELGGADPPAPTWHG